MQPGVPQSRNDDLVETIPFETVSSPHVEKKDVTAYDFHYYVSELQKPNPVDADKKREELDKLLVAQVSQEKKQEMFAYLHTQEHLFTQQQEPQHEPIYIEMFLYLIGHFPITLRAYTTEIYKEFPTLENRFSAEYSTGTPALKKKLVAVLQNQLQLSARAIRLGSEEIQFLANRLQGDINHLLSQPIGASKHILLSAIQKSK